MLKSDMHIHCKGDPEDKYIQYSAKDYLDHAASLGFNVLSFTNHTAVLDVTPLQSYAKKKGIVLIPGAEARVEGRDTLLYNFTQKQVDNIKSFDDLRRIKSKDQMVIAPHPFYSTLEPPFFKKRCLDQCLIDNIDLFDGIEFCNFYMSYFNLNKKAVQVSKNYSLPLVGNSDAHYPYAMNSTYSLIDSKPNAKDIIAAIKNKKVKLVSSPRPAFQFFKMFIKQAVHFRPKTL